MRPAFPSRIAYDCVLKRPACVNLQAVLGGSPALAMEFPVELWLMSPTENLHVYRVENIDQFEALKAITWKKRR